MSVTVWLARPVAGVPTMNSWPIRWASVIALKAAVAAFGFGAARRWRVPRGGGLAGGQARHGEQRQRRPGRAAVPARSGQGRTSTWGARSSRRGMPGSRPAQYGYRPSAGQIEAGVVTSICPGRTRRSDGAPGACEDRPMTGDLTTRDLGTRRPGAQPARRRRRHAARRARRGDRCVGLGQVLARVRHDLRRGAGPLPRVGGPVRAPADRPDRRAGRPRDHRPAARRRVPAVARHAAVPLDGRHAHDALVLAADAVLPGRRLPGRRGPTRLRRVLAQHRGRGVPEVPRLGRVHEVTEASLVPDPSLSIRDRAVAAWPGAWQGKNYRDILATLGYDVDRPWRELPRPTASGSCSPTSSRSSRCMPSARRTASSGPTRARTRARGATCCTRWRRRRARRCAESAAARGDPAVPGLRRRGAAARGAGGHGRRRDDRRAHRAAADRAGGPLARGRRPARSRAA